MKDIGTTKCALVLLVVAKLCRQAHCSKMLQIVENARQITDLSIIEIAPEFAGKVSR